MSFEKSPLVAAADASVTRGAGAFELGFLKGTYFADCIRPKRRMEGRYEPLWSRHGHIMNLAEGRMFSEDELAELAALKAEMSELSELAWKAEAPNTVCTEGKNLALDTFLAGAAYTVVGPFLGLISSTSWSATAATDIAAQINGTNAWKEAGHSARPPEWTTPAADARATTNAGWASAAAGSKALSAAKAFSISTSGTVKGAFLVYGTGAVATNADTNGKLMSAGVFSGGDKVVANLDTLNVSYSLAF